MFRIFVQHHAASGASDKRDDLLTGLAASERMNHMVWLTL